MNIYDGKILIPFSDCQPASLGHGSINFCSWERLRPFLEQAAGLRPNEYIKGIRADGQGIDICIGHKSEKP